MVNKHGNGIKPDSMKRKQDTLAEDATPDLKRGGSRKKKNNLKKDILGSAKAATTGTTGEIVQAIVPHSNLTTIKSGDFGIDSVSSVTITVSDGKTSIPDDTPAKPTLQTLPRELRDLIYGFVAATEERIVLGRRMTEARRTRYKTETLYESFKEAIALHPLSMTCHQFLDEFQTIHTVDSEVHWVLLVNNFDLDQIKSFSDFIQSGQYIQVTRSKFNQKEDEYCEDWTRQVPSYNFPVSLRFQMDNHALESANSLRRYILDHEGEAPRSLANPNITRRWFGVAEISTEYLPRTSAPMDESKGMTLEQAERVHSEFSQIRETLFDVLDEMEMCGERDYGGEVIADSWGYMEWCWFEPFADALILMEDAEEAST